MPHSYRATYHGGFLHFIDEKPVNEDGDVIVTFLNKDNNNQETKRLDALNSLNQLFKKIPEDEMASFDLEINRKPLLTHRNLDL